MALLYPYCISCLFHYISIDYEQFNAPPSTTSTHSYSQTSTIPSSFSCYLIPFNLLTRHNYSLLQCYSYVISLLILFTETSFNGLSHFNVNGKEQSNPTIQHLQYTISNSNYIPLYIHALK